MIAVEKDGSTPLTIVIATLSEEEGIGPTIEELKMTLEDPTYLVVDGNSVDRTALVQISVLLLKKSSSFSKEILRGEKYTFCCVLMAFVSIYIRQIF